MKISGLKSALIPMIGIAILFTGCNSSSQKDESSQTEQTTTSNENSTMKTETIEVNGNCGMCKDAIEGALKKEIAISSSEWNQETKKLTVSYDPEKITIDKIHQLVADVGYDTDKVKAKDEVYNNLHGCCQYDRKK